MEEMLCLWVFFTRPAVRNGRKPAGNLAFHGSFYQFKKSKKVLQEIGNPPVFMQSAALPRRKNYISYPGSLHAPSVGTDMHCATVW
jgi:hypothetical protein